jgi:hypothetical protein
MRLGLLLIPAEDEKLWLAKNHGQDIWSVNDQAFRTS